MKTNTSSFQIIELKESSTTTAELVDYNYNCSFHFTSMYVSADGKPRSRHVIIIVRGVVCMLNLHKTGYEKTGFEARVCAEGVNHDGDCSEIDPKQ